MPDGSHTPLYLVIDQGGHASRAFVFDHHGNEQSRGSVLIEARTSALGHVEYSADQLLQSIHSAIETAVSAPGIKLTDIVAAGMATQRSNTACWDRLTGEPLTPIISWQDRRAAGWMSQFESHSAQIHQRTGLFPSPHYGVGKLKWCFDNLPQVRNAHQRQRLCWGPMSSFLLHRLLDERPYLVDHVNASRTLLWDINRRTWAQALMQLFELPNNPLPHCVPSQHHFGRLVINGHHIPMTTVIGDQSASLFAWQQLQDDALYINIGTGAFVQKTTGERCIIKPQLLSSLLLQQQTHATYALEGTVNGAGSALSWIEQQLRPHNLYQQLPQWLQQNDHSMLFLNGISGIGSPFWQSDFNSRFIGEGNEPQQIVSVIESIAFLLQLNIEQLQQQSPRANRILISGGLAQLDGLCQRIADLSGLPLQRMAECEATASGVAWLLTQQSSTTNDNRLDWCQYEIKSLPPHENPALATRYQQWQTALQTALA